MNRKKLSTKNAFVAIITQSIILIGQFILQTVFVKCLSISYLGANGLFTNVVSFLSFAELGIGAAITFSLYKPLAEKNEQQINAIMRLFKNAYEIIGTCIFVFGMIFSFFIENLVKAGQSVPHLQFLFILYLLSTVVSYFFTYTRSLLIANQDGYINSVNQAIFKTLQIIAQIPILIFTKQYALYLVIMIITNLLSNIRITKLTFKRFPFLNLKTKNKVPQYILVKMKQNVVGTVSSKIGEIVVFGTDNILISKFLGLAIIGIYSNYMLIINGISSVLNQGISALISSFGNLGATENLEYQEKIFFNYLFLVSALTYILVSTFSILVQGFMKMWFGSNFILSNLVVLIISINFSLTEIRQACLGFVSALGLFWPMRYKSLIEAAINLSLSLVFIIYFHMGLLGVLFGTLCSTLLINMWWEPLVLFKYGFKSKIKPYFLKLFQYLLLLVGTQFIILCLFSSMQISNIFEALLIAILAIVIFTMLFLLFFMRTAECKYFVILIKRKAKK